jgi:glycosyltransferase involved in cell wall biosynthesis
MSDKSLVPKSVMVSVIIPAHNYGHYISEAIDSALAQTYRNLEIIVIDDGSTDDTRSKVEKYSMVKYIYQEHKGQATPARAINKGLTVSRGKYVVVLAADDRLHPTYIERCLRLAQSDPNVGMVWTGSQYFGTDSKRLIGTVMPITKNPLILFSPIAKLNGAIGTAMIPMKVYAEVGVYDESLPSAEDVDLCIRILRHHWKAKPISEPLHQYRMHNLNDNVAMKQLGWKCLYRKYPSLRPFKTVSGLIIRTYRFFRHPKYTATKVQAKLLRLLKLGDGIMA